MHWRSLALVCEALARAHLGLIFLEHIDQFHVLLAPVGAVVDLDRTVSHSELPSAALLENVRKVSLLSYLSVSAPIPTTRVLVWLALHTQSYRELLVQQRSDVGLELALIACFLAHLPHLFQLGGFHAHYLGRFRGEGRGPDESGAVSDLEAADVPDLAVWEVRDAVVAAVAIALRVDLFHAGRASLIPEVSTER